MTVGDDEPERQEHILDTHHLADALESDLFKQFLDHVPVAIVVAELNPAERITYANLEFERLTGRLAAEMENHVWADLPGRSVDAADGRRLGEVLAEGQDYVGVFTIEHDGVSTVVDAWSNIIEDDSGRAIFRLVALAEIGHRDAGEQAALEDRIREKDVLLRELQHRVKNNLQMITALIRLEARNLPEDQSGERFERLAGRIQALALLYRALSDHEPSETVDLGVYLSQIGAAVMQAHAREGIRLDLKVDAWPASINVAMPAGLVVNEVLTNSLKHAFAGRDKGVVTLHSLVDDNGCRVVLADDGLGLAEGEAWPKPGKLGALMVQSLRQNADARVQVTSRPGKGVQVIISFSRAKAAPET